MKDRREPGSHLLPVAVSSADLAQMRGDLLQRPLKSAGISFQSARALFLPSNLGMRFFIIDLSSQRLNELLFVQHIEVPSEVLIFAEHFCSQFVVVFFFFLILFVFLFGSWFLGGQSN